MDPYPIFGIRKPEEFLQAALHTFRDQYLSVGVYREFCEHLGVKPDQVTTLDDIPFLPIEFFKTRQVIRNGASASAVFRSSGTTGSVRSTHYVADPELYRQCYTRGFTLRYGSPADLCILALLPSYADRPDSSLIAMVDGLIGGDGITDSPRRETSEGHSGSPNQSGGSGFISGEPRGLAARITQADAGSQPVLLLGVSFALLDLAESEPMQLENTIIMETGGMKGRRVELVRQELHKRLCKGFGVDRIHSEYGMTELLSQAYSAGNGLYQCPPWMNVRVRDPEDPLSRLDCGVTGGLDIIDLANRDSCAFIATQDLGRTYPDRTFEVLGRFDNSDIRGCNLMAL